MSVADKAADRFRADHAGVAASTLCAVHCLAGGVLAGVSGVAPVFTDSRVEIASATLAVALAASALAGAYRRHGRCLPCILGGFGIAALAVARLAHLGSEAVEAAVSLAGGGLLVTAHVTNIRALRCARACCAERG